MDDSPSPTDWPVPVAVPAVPPVPAPDPADQFYGDFAHPADTAALPLVAPVSVPDPADQFCCDFYHSADTAAVPLVPPVLVPDPAANFVCNANHSADTASVPPVPSLSTPDPAASSECDPYPAGTAAIAPIPSVPVPDPAAQFDRDSYHPADHTRPGFADYAAAPTLCRVKWMGHDPNTPAGNQSDETVASVVDAYRSLPNPLAVETITLAHVGLAHTIVANIANLAYPDAMHLEPQGYATIAEEWFSIALLKLLQVVKGDRAKGKNDEKTPGLRSIGKEHGWDDWDEPKHIAKYLGKAVRNEIWRCYKTQEKVRRRTVLHLLKSHSFEKAGRVKRGEIEQEEQVSCQSGPCVAFHEETPERVAAENEALNRALAECAKARALAKHPRKRARGRALSERDRNRALADCDTFDIFDRLLLTMKRENLLSQKKMGEQLGLKRDQVQRRLRSIRKAMEADLELPHKGQGKRKAKNPLPVHSAKEALVDVPDGDIFDRLLTEVRKGLLAEVEMAARLGWTRDQLQRRLYAMREANGGCSKEHHLLDALFLVRE
jgi:hypothetical protein